MTNDKIQMTNQAQNLNDSKKYDLEERSAQFGGDIIIFLKSISKDSINNSLISQLIRSATSVGANYMEADCAETKKDFKYRISICKKESKETQYWLRVIAKAIDEENLKESCRKLWQEAKELSMIFATIASKTV